jgi:two-component sensor histidine kinase
LISNSLQHGFPDGRAGVVRVSLQPGEAAAWWRLCVSDTGVGLPLDFDAKRQTTLGLQLAGDLAEQIGGVLEVNLNRPSGAEFWVGFEVA